MGKEDKNLCAMAIESRYKYINGWRGHKSAKEEGWRVRKRTVDFVYRRLKCCWDYE